MNLRLNMQFEISGFLGKVIVEKLLRDCPDIKKIFVLIRTKKGISPYERLEGFKKHQVRKVLWFINVQLHRIGLGFVR